MTGYCLPKLSVCHPPASPPSSLLSFPRDSPTQREAARSEGGEALRQTEARAGGQRAIDGQHIDRDAERHLQWTGREKKEGEKANGGKKKKR